MESPSIWYCLAISRFLKHSNSLKIGSQDHYFITRFMILYTLPHPSNFTCDHWKQLLFQSLICLRVNGATPRVYNAFQSMTFPGLKNTRRRPSWILIHIPAVSKVYANLFHWGAKNDSFQQEFGNTPWICGIKMVTHALPWSMGQASEGAHFETTDWQWSCRDLCFRASPLRSIVMAASL